MISVLYCHNRIPITLERVLIVGFVLSGFFLLTQKALAAEVILNPSVGTYSAGRTFTVTVQALPDGGESINAVESTLTFNTSLLSVVSISKAGSVFSLWTTEPTFSNSAGTIEFGGGSPTPFSTRSTIAVITFRALSEGTATVAFQGTSALAADGLGTDVLSRTGGGTYTINGAATPTETPPGTLPQTPSGAPSDSGNAAIAFGDPPRTPEIGSKQFLDPNLWYATTTGLFTWELPFDITQVAIDVATSSNAEPETVYDPPIEEFRTSTENLSDGIQYLTVQFRNQVGWGAILHRKLMIDTVAPAPFTINVRAGNAPSDFPVLTFEAKDGTSGIDRYELTIAENEPVVVTPAEARLGYLLGKLEDGTYTVHVVAYDKAGNERKATTPVLITAGWSEPLEITEEQGFFAFLTFTRFFIFLLILIIIGLISLIVIERKRNMKREAKLRKETKEIQDQMEKIFSALRDEIYDQINMITKKPRLSKKEREAVEGLNQALEVSETLIEKEITDVEKILK